MNRMLFVIDSDYNVSGGCVQNIESYESKGIDIYTPNQLNLFRANIIIRDKKNVFVGLYYYKPNGEKIDTAPIVMGMSNNPTSNGLYDELIASGKKVVEDVFVSRTIYRDTQDGDEIPPMMYEPVACLMSKYLTNRG